MSPGALSTAGFALLVGATVASASLAQEVIGTEAEERIPRYQVEVIVFAHEDFDPNEELVDISLFSDSREDDGQIPERKYFDALSRVEVMNQVDAPIVPSGDEPRELPPFSDELLAIEMFTDGDAAAANIRVLERDEWQLNEVYQTLDRLSAYTPIVHGGWAQDGVDEDNAVPFDLVRLGAPGHLGTIQLHVSRFLHVTVDLEYRPRGRRTAIAQVAGPAGAIQGFGGISNGFDSGPVYKLSAERRILRGELNYIDHPAFGLVVLITLEPESTAGEGGEPASPAL